MHEKYFVLLARCFMPYVPHTEEDIRQMLEVIGIGDIDSLFKSIPHEIRVKAASSIPDGASEQDTFGELYTLSDQNMPLTGEVSFLGGGPMRMYRPAVINAIISRSEFITSYTPYQAEISQGLLQAIYEYQTMVSQLMGMDLANASSYDCGTAAADALVVARDNFRGKRNFVMAAENIHPEIREVMKTYNVGLEMEWEDIPTLRDGRIDSEFVEKRVCDDTAAVFIQYPNRYGVIEDLSENGLSKVIGKIHDAGALAVAIVNPIACAALVPPGDIGFDIAVAEGQPISMPIAYGGPYLGIFAVKNHLMRKLPGRISGKTVDVDGNEGYILTLQAREQHIRRERATSNICTNQSLCALAAAIYMSYYGKERLPKLARKIMGLTSYAAKAIGKLKRYELVHPESPHFHEIVIKCPIPARYVNEALMEQGIIGGLAMEKWGEDAGWVLLGFSDENTTGQIDDLVSALNGIG